MAADGWRDSAATVDPHGRSGRRRRSGCRSGTPSTRGPAPPPPTSVLDLSVGAATLQGSAGVDAERPVRRGALAARWCRRATANHVKLPDNIQAGMDDEFTRLRLGHGPTPCPTGSRCCRSAAARTRSSCCSPRPRPNAAGATGFAATFKAPGNATQERLTLGARQRPAAERWTHVVYTHSGTTGKIYFDGELQGTRDELHPRHGRRRGGWQHHRQHDRRHQLAGRHGSTVWSTSSSCSATS